MALARTGGPQAARISLHRIELRAWWASLGLSRTALNAEAPVAWAVGAPVAVVTLIVAGAMLEPAPANEATGAAAVIDAVIASVLMAALVVTAIGAMTLRRWGIATAMGMALFTLGLVVTCPLSGHHTFGLWFVGQLGCTLAATGVATAAMLRTKG
ncbi:MAG: hypothetical protein ACREN5_05800 [Gemmatimonadales bacterium]